MLRWHLASRKKRLTEWSSRLFIIAHRITAGWVSRLERGIRVFLGNGRCRESP